jgi:hypothetical protein
VEIDMLYTDILSSAVINRHGQRDPHLARRLRTLLGAIILVFEPLSMTSLAVLTGVREQEVKASLRSITAVLLHTSDHDDASSVVHIFHPSLRDFLLHRCEDASFSINHTEHHHCLAVSCLGLLNANLHQNMCNIESPSISNLDVDNPNLRTRVQIHVSDTLRYSCTYWLVHIALAGPPNMDLIHTLRTFTSEHLLHWVELLSLLGLVSHAAKLLRSASVWCKVSSFTRDMT